MKKYSRAEAWIHLDRVEENIGLLKEKLREDTQILAVVKTDGYGHGGAEIAQLLEPEACIFGFAVAIPEEGICLRKAGIRKPILILGTVPREQQELLFDWKLMPAVYSLKTAESLSAMGRQKNQTLQVHMKVDTGMSRIGLQTSEQGLLEAEKMVQLPFLEWEGIFTHMARADETDKTGARKQIKEFRDFIEALQKAGVEFPYHHIANSAGIMELPEAEMELVRAGIAMYGIEPSKEVGRTAVLLRPVLELKSCISFIKELEAGREISYGGTYVLPKPMRIGTIPVGYGDGYPRSLSNKGWILVHGKKAPILGRICMDQFMVDLTDIPEAEEGQEVTLIGRCENAELSIEELGVLSGRFPYEFACDLGKRIPRVFLYKGEIRGSRDNF
jgi:alanine racemase